MDKSRQQFEDYILNKPNAHIDPLKMSRFGYYYYHVTRKAWDAWQASRESLGVELPDGIEYDKEYRKCDYEEGYRKGYNNSLSECRQALISNGVKIKK